MTRVCPQCGNLTPEAKCAIDGWSTVPEGLLTDTGVSRGTVVFDRFRVGALLRHDGAMKVYGGIDLQTARPVDIHVLPLPAGTPLDVVARLQRGARALETVRHPTVASALASGNMTDGQLAIVTEHVAGPTLADRLKQGPLDAPKTAALGHALFSGLEAAHAAGVAHHDLTPERIVMPADDRIVIERTGLHDLVRTAHPEADDLMLLPHGLGYSAPEMVRNKLVTRQADIYSVGAILYEALTGKPVFEGPTAVDRLVQHLEKKPEVPTVGGQAYEGPLVELILHCLTKQPWNRPANATAARAAFEGATKGPAAWPATEPRPVEPEPVVAMPVKESTPAALITRDAGRPRVEARTEPHFATVVPLSKRERRVAWWPWLVAAALLALVIWATSDHRRGARSDGDVPVERTAQGLGAREAAERARLESQAKAEAQAMADERAKAEAQAKADELAKAEAQAKADELARAEAQAKADELAKAEAQAKAAQDPKAKAAAEAQAKADAQAKAKAEADAKRAAEAQAKADAQAKAKAEADAKRAAEAQAKADAQAKAKAEADAKRAADAKAKAEAEAKRAADAKAKAEADAKRAADAKATRPPVKVATAPTDATDKAKRDAEVREYQRQAAARYDAVPPRGAPAKTETPSDVAARYDAVPPKVTPVTPSDAPKKNEEQLPAAAFRRANVWSTPPGAFVVVDGHPVGRTPTALTWMPGFKGHAELRLDGYQVRAFDFNDATNGKTLNFQLQPK